MKNKKFLRVPPITQLKFCSLFSSKIFIFGRNLLNYEHIFLNRNLFGKSTNFYFENKNYFSFFVIVALLTVFRNWRELRNLFIFRVEFIRNSLIVFNLMLNLMP